MHDEMYKKVMDAAGKEKPSIPQNHTPPNLYHKVHEKAEHYKQ